MTANIVFGEPHFDEAEEERVLAVLRSRWIGQGPVVEEFETELARYVGSQHSVAVSSCTAALELSLMAAGVGPGDGVITTALTFVATVNAIDRVGATPVLVDIEPDTLNLDIDDVADSIDERTRAIVPVHFGGLPVDLRSLDRLTEETGIYLIEDAAHALGAVCDGRRIGIPRSDRNFVCFSFYPNKNLASAEGGAIVPPTAGASDHLHRLRLHGLDKDAWRRFSHVGQAATLALEPGLKANWTDLQAAIALAQLEKLEGFLAIREHIADLYDTLLSDLDIGIAVRTRPTPGLESRHALHLYQVRVEGGRSRRDAILREMRLEGVGAAIHYLAIPEHPMYSGRWKRPFPHARAAADELLSLPLHPGMSDLDVERVVDVLQAAASTGAGGPVGS